MVAFLAARSAHSCCLRLRLAYATIADSWRPAPHGHEEIARIIVANGGIDEKDKISCAY